MKSKTLKDLVSLPGLNIFNFRQKMQTIDGYKRKEPDDPESLEYKYFEQLIVQDKYIKALNRMLDTVEFEFEKLDIQLDEKEQEILSLKEKLKKASEDSIIGWQHRLDSVKKDNQIKETAIRTAYERQIKEKDEIIKQQKGVIKKFRTNNFNELQQLKTKFNAAVDNMNALKTYFDQQQKQST